MNNEIYAAIAMALHDEQGYNMHDSESVTLTITPHNTEWASKQAKMTNKRKNINISLTARNTP